MLKGLTECAIKIENLSKDYGSVLALLHMSLEIGAGKICGVVGPNGAGKTSLMRILACHQAPTQGSIRVLGRTWEKDDPEFKRNLGFLTREMQLFPKLTVFESLRHFARLHELSTQKFKSRLEELSSQLKLEAFLHKKFGTLSTGQKQRSNIASCLLHEPKILLLDEITASLDLIAARECLEAVKDQARKGATVLFCSHIMGEIEFVSDEIVFLANGKIIAYGTREELLKRFETVDLTSTFYKAASLKCA